MFRVGALIGAQALVADDIADFALVVGAPARFVRYVCPRGSRHVVAERADGPHCATCDASPERIISAG